MGYRCSEDFIAGELVVRESADLLPAVEDGDLAVAAFDADELAADAAADQDAAAVDADQPLQADLAHVGAGGVEAGGLRQRGGAGAGAGAPQPGGRAVAQRLVRAQRV